MTDTKTVEGISAKNYDLYLIEGNYDEDEIEERIKEKQQDCKYVYEFRAKDSHLSKQQASEFLLNNMGRKFKICFYAPTYGKELIMDYKKMWEDFKGLMQKLKK